MLLVLSSPQLPVVIGLVLRSLELLSFILACLLSSSLFWTCLGSHAGETFWIQFLICSQVYSYLAHNCSVPLLKLSQILRHRSCTVSVETGLIFVFFLYLIDCWFCNTLCLFQKYLSLNKVEDYHDLWILGQILTMMQRFFCSSEMVVVDSSP